MRACGEAVGAAIVTAPGRTDVRPDIVSDCDPGLVSRQFHAVFTSHPWRIVGGAMGG